MPVMGVLQALQRSKAFSLVAGPEATSKESRDALLG